MNFYLQLKYVNNAFETLSTKHKQTSFFKDNGEFVEPILVEVPGEDKKMLGYVLPIKPKLTSLLSLPEDNFRETNRDSFLKANKIQC